ncbi:hypothetical protein GCM10010404_58650 [Nonomuraea africana]
MAGEPWVSVGLVHPPPDTFTVPTSRTGAGLAGTRCDAFRPTGAPTPRASYLWLAGPITPVLWTPPSRGGHK